MLSILYPWSMFTHLVKCPEFSTEEGRLSYKKGIWKTLALSLETHGPDSTHSFSVLRSPAMQTLFSASMVGIDTSLERISLERPSLDKNHSTHVVELRGTDAMCPASMEACKTSPKETLKTMIKGSRTYCRESPGLKWCSEELQKLSLLPEKWSKEYNMKSPILQPLLAEGRTLEGIRAKPGVVRRKKGVAGAIRNGIFWVADEI